MHLSNSSASLGEGGIARVSYSLRGINLAKKFEGEIIGNEKRVKAPESIGQPLSYLRG